ncbi:MAG: 2,3,4,5-tetrahydropyridine-2,6-dicarboxylate N-succinyltransferase [Holosporaceae bacterium]|jgi:2,3,4,5-tetrahydropyridine-2-carboxylate N-succinyltransferase|nr:2,3,4,5-tetrahydropyridine-2,6-dicarboxylate N-succinyltransferase [Holosporaceae bacterium]
MMEEGLREKIEQLWLASSDDVKDEDIVCLHGVLEKLDRGELRIANREDDLWIVNEYLKKAILLYFKYTKSQIMAGNGCSFFDKVSLKTQNWTESDFVCAGFRAVPGSLIRYSAYIAKSVILMPCFVNVGAFVDEGTMIDTNALVGSCAQIGKGCHISDGVTIGGVLEPLQSTPVIIEDNCFIGARSVVSEGVIVKEGAILGAGTILSSSTKIIHRETGEISYGKIPSHSVVVSGSYLSKNINLGCAVIIKQVDELTRKKTSINELLRE